MAEAPMLLLAIEAPSETDSPPAPFDIAIAIALAALDSHAIEQSSKKSYCSAPRLLCLA
jgi:hypothetical protein